MPTCDELLEPAPARLLDQVQAHRHVGEEEPAGVVAVGADAADLRRQVQHDRRACIRRSSRSTSASRVRSYVPAADGDELLYPRSRSFSQTAAEEAGPPVTRIRR